MKKSYIKYFVALLGLLILGIYGIASIPRPVKVGELVKNPDGSFQFKRDWNGGDPEMPMFVKKYDTGEQMWGYILLDHTNDVKYVIEGLRMKPVPYGNFMDTRYTPGNWTFPIWCTDGFIDPLTGTNVKKQPAMFYIPVWLDGRS